jgi:hypothetical protein
MPVSIVTLASGSIVFLPIRTAIENMDPILYGEVWIFLLLWLGAWEFIGNGVDGVIDFMTERNSKGVIAQHPRATKLIFYGAVIVLATILIFTVSTADGFREASGVHHEPLLFQG